MQLKDVDRHRYDDALGHAVHESWHVDRQHQSAQGDAPRPGARRDRRSASDEGRPPVWLGVHELGTRWRLLLGRWRIVRSGRTRLTGVLSGHVLDNDDLLHRNTFRIGRRRP